MDRAQRDGDGSAASRQYVHDALVFNSADQLAAGLVPFVLDGFAAGEPVVVAAGDGAVDVLRQAVGDDPRLRVLDRSVAYPRRTATAIARFRQLAAGHPVPDGARVRVVGEADVGPTERTWLEWQRYDAVINQALADRPLWGLCLFDAGRLPGPVLESVELTHPTLVTDGGRVPSPRFVDPARYLRELPIPPEPLEGTPPRLAVAGVGDFVALRHAVTAELATVAAPRDTVEDFLLAVDETASNAVRHGRPPVDLTLWVGGDRLVCRIRDRGDGLTDPFAGYGPAHGEDLSRGGMGVWLARQLCDHVDVCSGADGTTVRLTTRVT
ncbi:sensor histidine kinase [Geodermatophilus sabuli]|uniref:Sensor histidine kinase n=1 Tax=Geodermatophilus sabuli TaxID=1564158 RepID=A0A7K3VVR6_9ACTN|nr:sensor histidine kinase [Geodermatophilus sabuli]